MAASTSHMDQSDSSQQNQHQKQSQRENEVKIETRTGDDTRNETDKEEKTTLLQRCQKKLCTK